MKEALEFLLLSEEHPDDTIAYLDAGTVSNTRSVIAPDRLFNDMFRA